MAKGNTGWTLGELAALLGGEPFGDLEMPLSRPANVDSDDPEGVAFAEGDDFLAIASASEVGCVIVRKGAAIAKAHIAVDDPRTAFHKLLLASVRPLPLDEGIHPLALVSPYATVDPTARIGAYVVVEAGATVGPMARIYPLSYIGENCQIGEGSILYPSVVLYQDVAVGRFCIVHSGAVLGADGFGFVWDGRRRVKVPQVGGVRLGDDVEVGANSAIDRSTMGETRLGEGVKLDNLIQVGHNVKIGDHSVIAGHSSIGGSSTVGDRAMIGGHVAIKDHVTVTDDVVLAGRSGVTSDVAQPGAYFGLPLQPHRDGLRTAVLSAKLPDLFSRLRALEQRVKELERE